MRLWDSVKAAAEGVEDDGSYEAPSGPEDCARRRADALATESASIELPRDWGDKPYGVVVEIGGSRGVTTLIAFANGDSSLLRADGSGMIGQPNHVHVVIQSKRLVEAAGAFAVKLRPSAEPPFPGNGRVGFHLLTRQGVLSAEEDLETVRAGESPFTPLLEQADELMSECLQYLITEDYPPQPLTVADWVKALAMVAVIGGVTYAAWLIPIAWIRWPAFGIGLFFTLAALIVPYAMLTASKPALEKPGEGAR